MAENKLNGTKRDTGIVLLRVCSMFMIILCHCSAYVGLSWLAQFLNVGVYVFLFISGWLYSKKAIARPTQWMLNRWKKICVPALVWTMMVIVYALSVKKESPQWSDVLLLAANFQGLSFVFPFFPSLSAQGALSGLGNLWFVTVIMLCYLIVLAAKWNEKQGDRRFQMLYGIGSIICFLILGLFRINLSYFIIFLIGYGIGKKDGCVSMKQFVFSTCAMTGAVALRLAAKHWADGTAFYEIIVVGISHSIISMWIFFTVRLIEQRISLARAIASSKLFLYLDGMSYYIYVTHYYFLIKQFGLKELVPGIGLQMLVFCVLSLATAAAVKKISHWIVST